MKDIISSDSMCMAHTRGLHCICRVDRRRGVLQVILSLIVVFLTNRQADAAHPFHTTFAEMEWNEDTQRFEVALQLPGLQIDEELSRIHQRRINLESTTDAEALLREYIESRYEVTDKVHSKCRLHWVGMEVELKVVWAYFEVELISDDQPKEKKDDTTQAGSQILQKQDLVSPELQGLTLSNRILTEALNEQLNMVSIRISGRKTSVNFTNELTRRAVEF